MFLFSIVASAQPAPARTAQRPPAASDSADNSLLQRAQADLDNNDYSAAAEKYRNYLTSHPDDAQIHFQLGYCNTALGQADAARAEYEKATQLDPTLAPAFLNLGLTLIGQGSAQAVAPLQRAAELMPDDPKPQILLATALSLAGRMDEALAKFAALAQNDANDGMLHREYGSALLRANRYSEAEKELHSALEIDPDDAAIRLQLAICLSNQEKYDQSVVEYAAYLKGHPDVTLAQEYRGRDLILSGHIDDGVAELQRAASEPGAIADLLIQDYDGLLAEKRYDDAMALLLKAERIDPQNPKVHAALGDAFAQRKAYPDAAREFQAVLKVSPDDTSALAGLSAVAYAARDYSATLNALAMLEQKQSLPVADLFARADSYDKLGKKAEALDGYEKYLAVNTDQNNDMYFAASARVRELKRQLGKK